MIVVVEDVTGQCNSDDDKCGYDVAVSIIVWQCNCAGSNNNIYVVMAVIWKLDIPT